MKNVKRFGIFLSVVVLGMLFAGIPIALVISLIIYLIPDIYIIIAGCLPHITPKYIEIIKNIIPSFAAIINLDNIEDLPEIFEKIKIQ